MINQNEPILFYGGGWNCFSNFSSYMIEWRNKLWPTSEHAYQAAKFLDTDIQDKIKEARSAYDAKKLAEHYKDKIRNDWHTVNLLVMEDILRQKLSQHLHIRKKLVETGDREIIEASEDDSFWGWGSEKKGDNHHGKIWMKLRTEIFNKK